MNGETKKESLKGLRYVISIITVLVAVLYIAEEFPNIDKASEIVMGITILAVILLLKYKKP